jgi:hypothetical protein
LKTEWNSAIIKGYFKHNRQPETAGQPMRIQKSFQKITAYDPNIDISRFSDSKAGFFVFLKPGQKEQVTICDLQLN